MKNLRKALNYLLAFSSCYFVVRNNFPMAQIVVLWVILDNVKDIRDKLVESK